LWYTPSGRSINRPHRTSDDEDAPDAPVQADTTRPHFRSDAGRTVLGGGGIVPDVEVPSRVSSKADRALQTALGDKLPRFRDAIVDYALSLKASHGVPSLDFAVTPAMRDELYRRMVARGVTLDRAVYDAATPLVDRVLGAQVARYAFGARAEFDRSLRQDSTVLRAVALLRGATSPKTLLQRAPR
jgi:carboxyl-terminal processing protease